MSALVALCVVCVPGAVGSQSSALTCPDTGTPVVQPGTYAYQGRFTTFTCSYSDGLHGFDLLVAYYPVNTPSAELPSRTGPRWCKGYTEKPYTVYSTSVYAYAQASGNPPDWTAAFTQATGFLAQAAAVAHSCTGASSGTASLTVHALVSQGVYPHPVKLKFRLSDTSGQARAGAVVFQGKRPIYRFAYRTLRATNTLWWFKWKPPARFRTGVQLSFCVSATDTAGAKATSCAHFSVLQP